MRGTVYVRVHGQLDPGERLLWCGRPRGASGRTIGMLIPILFMVIWTGIALGAALDNRAEGQPVADVLVPLLMGLGGLVALVYLVIWMIFGDVWTRRRVAYGLTDRRVIIIDGRTVRSLPLHTLVDITLQERADRSGTIRCFVRGTTNKRGVPVSRPLFRRIVDARYVYALLLDARERPPARPPAATFSETVR